MKILSGACVLWFAAMGGFFFAFSATVMPAWKVADPAVAMQAMQAINLVVRNPYFAIGYFGALVFCLVGVFASLLHWRQRRNQGYLLFGCTLYFAGAFLLTVLGNVPLNTELASLNADSTGLAYWAEYQQRWALLNHLRMFISFAAAFVILFSLFRGKCRY